jgi:hypothetical protein
VTLRRHRLLTQGLREAPERHRTLHAALNLLPVPERTALARAAVFFGRLTLPV